MLSVSINNELFNKFKLIEDIKIDIFPTALLNKHPI